MSSMHSLPFSATAAWKACLSLLLSACLSAATVRFDVIPERSTVAARTGKAGVLSAFAGHEHGILADRFSARICADPETLEDATVLVQVPTAGLRIDTLAARRAARLSGSGPSAKDVATIQEKMLSPANLAAADHREIRFESTSVRRNQDTVVLGGTLSIRGRRNNVSVPLRIGRSEDLLRFSGEFPIRLSDYGITPESIAGVVKVKDTVTIILDLLARPTQDACR